MCIRTYMNEGNLHVRNDILARLKHLAKISFLCVGVLAAVICSQGEWLSSLKIVLK